MSATTVLVLFWKLLASDIIKLIRVKLLCVVDPNDFSAIVSKVDAKKLFDVTFSGAATVFVVVGIVVAAVSNGVVVVVNDEKVVADKDKKCNLFVIRFFKITIS